MVVDDEYHTKPNDLYRNYNKITTLSLSLSLAQACVAYCTFTNGDLDQEQSAPCRQCLSVQLKRDKLLSWGAAADLFAAKKG